VKELGADYAVDVNEAVKFVKKDLRGVHASIVFSPKIAGFELRLKLLIRGGVFVSVGMPPASDGPLSISPVELFLTNPIIISSAVGTVVDMRELVQLAAEGKVKTHVSRVGNLSEINQIIEELGEGKYSGRAIIGNMAE
jgi:D-arabinose 1-dehydrogenase-like Zn-dependent alcohol dehydrogenase